MCHYFRGGAIGFLGGGRGLAFSDGPLDDAGGHCTCILDGLGAVCGLGGAVDGDLTGGEGFGGLVGG